MHHILTTFSSISRIYWLKEEIMMSILRRVKISKCCMLMVLYSYHPSYSDILEDRGLAITKLFRKLFCPCVCVCLCVRQHNTLFKAHCNIPYHTKCFSICYWQDIHRSSGQTVAKKITR